MKRTVSTLILAVVSCSLLTAQTQFGDGTLTVTPVAHNAVRIHYRTASVPNLDLPEWLYVSQRTAEKSDIVTDINARRKVVTVKDRRGNTVFRATAHDLRPTHPGFMPADATVGEATLTFDSPKGERLFGLGQFQDGFADVRGLSRRLTQVNTQISLPLLISNKGYGILWNNYGLTEFNPCANSVSLARREGGGEQEVVNVTSTEGGRREVRQRNVFEADIDIPATADYAIMLDVGQKMARRHNLVIDGQTVIEMQNVWLPPTASDIVHLKRGRHHVTAELTHDDRPTLYYNKVEAATTFRSPVAGAVDYTVFVGTPDEIIATYRRLTGEAPLIPSWALGYIHCRERFHSQQEILETANTFRQRKLPVSVIVQDWQWWGRHGWNAMRFDEEHYPDPKALTDSLHAMDMRLMLSVWSKIDRRSEVGQQMERDAFYIPGTDWIDFFNPAAAAAYWANFRDKLVPLGIDAWWQDATEPENDDLAGRRVNAGRWPGELVRNVYPLLVNKTVYEGLREYYATSAEPQRIPFILTRSGFPGIQRYGAALWSGDVGNDWETLRRQIIAGLGVQAAGVPWWTYDAGGFFRPGDQYTNKQYIERMLRWIETSVFLPLMRVHGYMSDTEPWRYGDEALSVITQCLNERERMRPYLERCARRVAEEGYTIMRPLVFDFADDDEALRQDTEYMFGPDFLVCPITQPDVREWRCYLPRNAGGWRHKYSDKHYAGGQYVNVPVEMAHIPVFVRE